MKMRLAGGEVAPGCSEKLARFCVAGGVPSNLHAKSHVKHQVCEVEKSMLRSARANAVPPWLRPAANWSSPSGLAGSPYTFPTYVCALNPNDPATAGTNQPS